MSSSLWQLLKTLTYVICVVALGSAQTPPTSGWTDFKLRARTVWQTVRADRTIHQSRTAAEMEELVTKLRAKHPAWGGRKLARRLLDLGHAGVPGPSTITAILQRHHYSTRKSLPSIKPFCASSGRRLMSSGRWTSKANSNFPRVVVIR